MDWSNVLLMISICCIMLMLRIFILFKAMKNNVTKKSMKCCRTIAVVGSGGHTSELIELLKALSTNYYPRIYVIADTDKRSLSKIDDFEKSLESNKDYNIIKVKRSREVAQSWISTIYTTFIALIESFCILLQHKPNLILCNGPGTCIPVCLAAFSMRIFFLNNTKIIFVESICRVQTLSLSGRILYYIADRFIVQWKELLQKYPKAVYIGTIV